MNGHILNSEIQDYIWAQRQASPAKLALQKSPFQTVSSPELATQIDGWQRTQRKVPLWADKKGLYFPDKLNLEQCSSQETAVFKASLVDKNMRLIDLTGGFGVDSFFFADKVKEVVHCELNDKLSSIVAHNMKQLGRNNVQCVAGDGITYLENSTSDFDVIYLDPSRRVNQQKVFRLNDCEPDILKLQDLFFSKASTVITKLAPLLDIQLALASLPHVSDIYIVSLNNDCKELVFKQQKGFDKEANIHAVQLSTATVNYFSFKYSEEKEATPSYSIPQQYLYDPDVSLSKSGAFKSIALAFQLSKLQPSSHLYTSEHLIAHFPGRIFSITETIPIAQFKKQNHIKQANVATKNFPLKVDEIRKKYKIKDGGPIYLYFTKQIDEQYIVIVAERINSL